MNIVTRFGGNTVSIQALAELARISETAELYQNMYAFMTALIQRKHAQHQDLEVDERNLFAICVKHIKASLRRSLENISDVESKDNDVDWSEDHYQSYKASIASQFEQFSLECIALIEQCLLSSVQGNADETEVFYLKLLGDMYHGLAQWIVQTAVDNDAYKVSAQQWYQQGLDLAAANLNPTHPTRLALAFNASTFYKVVMKDEVKSATLAKKAFDASIEKLDTLNDCGYKDSTLIMQMLRDSLSGAPDVDVDDDDEKIGLAVGGARDINNFRQCIENNRMPSADSITYNGLLYNYYFDTRKKAKGNNNHTADADDSKKDDGSFLFSPSYCYARVNRLDFLQQRQDDDMHDTYEYYMTLGLNSNLRKKDLQRKRLNLVIILDRSGSMSDVFDGDRTAYYRALGNNDSGSASLYKTKMQVATECVVGVLQHLTPDDRFGLVLFDDKANIMCPLTAMREITDLSGLKERILSVTPGGGTIFECGYNKAMQCYANYAADHDGDLYDNRIILVTDAQPNYGSDGQTLLQLVRTCANNAENYIYSTFIGVGLDFNAQLIETISNTRGCNSFCVQSTDEFRRTMTDEFELMVNPLVFNVVLRINVEGGACRIDKVYGVSSAMEESVMNSGQVTKITTLFPSKKSKEKGGSKGGIQLIKLKKLLANANANGKLNVEIQVSFEDKFGIKHENIQYVALDEGDDDDDDDEGGGTDMIEASNFYDNSGIRKGILLCKYAEIMKQWIAHERSVNNIQTGGALTVSDKFQNIIKKFMSHFEQEMKAVNDDELMKELNLMKRMVK
eukprot:CAMPEP_0202728062 /NCGR_PEP_ID=MMETSP1385-20130828/185435_1 /ASSEMBLY_ACC=CAM_ASM_000861 /TAXON_ID=933848 /ORGANISM="Elphidium margaritaceum" /LENGTH=792 /DNA_ID=CAMNT_0049394307 /DNA_START=1086 /DNA_END=3464 /DNA_ORIENTATION=+